MNTFKGYDALIALENGLIFKGFSFGAKGENSGEIVFNTSISGYQEILTDPSYHGQIVVMTYPLIGNYGINPEDVESAAVRVAGFVVKEYCRHYSNFRAEKSLAGYLQESGIIAIEGVDTRQITRGIRTAGAMKCVISTEDLDPVSLTAKAKAAPGLVGQDFVSNVSAKKSYAWNDNGRYRVAVLDLGVKYNILRILAEMDCRVQVFPCHTGADEIMNFQPDGVFISNGPGDPSAIPYAVETVKNLLGKKPLFGICMGHQILGQALGGKTFKLKFGHRGANQPVRDESTAKVEITSQNHGFAVDLESITDKDVELSHMNLNDNTLEGLAHEKYSCFSVQYHPEAAPGPHDARYLFERFIRLMGKN